VRPFSPRFHEERIGRVVAASRVLEASVAVTVLTAIMLVCIVAAEPAGATFRGANGKIFFESTRTGSSQIFSMNPNGSGVTNVTSNRSLNEENPAVSPSGLKVAYEYAREVWVMNADGTGKRKVVGNTGGDATPSWSPDGKKFVFSRNRADIWVVNVDGTGQKRLTFTPNHQEYDPAYSPDGTKIAFVSDRDSSASFPQEIYTMNAADGSGIRRLTANGAFDGHPDWQPRR
jgi:Tol biopolymer transport system component